ncbi:MAG: hypothetical protein JJ900_04125 [Rhodospirillales bacterium]|nr:hypothetical protein [Rhodospirillales bacterium]MBO6786015.1 hypothetical protein [Rhodospirillales bacterium]
MIVLGLHGGVTLGQHEPGAAIAVNGRIVAACEEERYLRIKSAYGHLPLYSIDACLRIAGISMADVDLIVTPGETYDDFAERIDIYIRHTYGVCPRIERIHHQLAHLAAAFYGSGYDTACCVSLDATGDGSCGMIGYASREGGIKVLETRPTSESIGFFYTLMTYYLGFGDGDEYKVMGLAPYGEPTVDLTALIEPSQNGWNFDWSFVRENPPVRSPFEPLYAAKIESVIGQPRRQPGAPMTQFYSDVAHSVQDMTEKCIVSMMEYVKAGYPDEPNLVFGGGVALNCKANAEILKSNLFENVYVPPVSSDRGLALGAAYYGATILGDKPWPLNDAYTGEEYSDAAIAEELEANGIPYRSVDDPAEVAAKLIAEGRVIGWHQYRSEAGARALGARSILAACTDSEMKNRVNARVKYREEFRPFAPATIAEAATEYFDTGGQDFPYMCFTVPAASGAEKIIPSVIHVDGTARLQTVRSSDNELYYQTIKRYGEMTGVPVIMNTSFNLKGQPIVETPRDAIMTFFGCGIDALVIGNFVVDKPNGCA